MKLLVTITLFFVLLTRAFTQSAGVENALLWKVSGKGLTKPSYLFGTYHILTNSFLDTLPAVTKAYNEAELIAGELVIDSNIQLSLRAASQLKGTTLRELLPDSLYNAAGSWLKNEAGLDIRDFNSLNPITVGAIVTLVTHQKYFPNPDGEKELDVYFQENALKDGKQVIGLETIEVEINALFNQISLARQVEIMNEIFFGNQSIEEATFATDNAYKSEKLDVLQQLMAGNSYSPEEIKTLLDDRNTAWVLQLPELMSRKSLFVAVGAMHLTGLTGLVYQLREMGYTVTPLNLKGI